MALYQFTWSEFCDWYLELSKQDLYNGTPERKQTAQYVLWYTLENLLRLLHPFMPFITEEIWQALPGTKATPTIMQAPYPAPVTSISFPEDRRRYGTGHGGHQRLSVTSAARWRCLPRNRSP